MDEAAIWLPIKRYEHHNDDDLVFKLVASQALIPSLSAGDVLSVEG